jgi:hypothetical protein
LAIEPEALKERKGPLTFAMVYFSWVTSWLIIMLALSNAVVKRFIAAVNSRVCFEVTVRTHTATKMGNPRSRIK